MQPTYPTRCTMLSRNVDECKPLVSGGLRPGSDVQRAVNAAALGAGAAGLAAGAYTRPLFGST